MRIVRDATKYGVFLSQSLRSDVRKAMLGRPEAEGEMGEWLRALREDGIVVVPGYMSPERCDEIRGRILPFVDQYDQTTLLDNGVRLHFRGTSATQYEYSNAKTVDQGMIDVFDIDHQFPDLADVKTDAKLLELVRRATGSARVQPASLHSYINRSITQTRGYHIDSPITQLKAFIYLTDVHDVSDGPYSFVKGSHRFSFQKYALITRNYMRGYYLSEMSKPPADSIVHALGPRGTLVVSDQNGSHRGMPQADGRERVLLTVSYKNS